MTNTATDLATPMADTHAAATQTPSNEVAAEATAEHTTPATAEGESGPKRAGERRSGGRGRRGAGGQNEPARQSPRGARPAQARPAREVHPVLQKLFELYPLLFGASFLPLKLGVFHDLMARHPDEFKKDELKLAMGQHARSTRYLECVAAGLARHDLDGNPVEPVAPEHVHHAILEVFRRRQARSKEDLRPRLTQKLIAAIEASGLSREAYAERVRVQDEATNALLDDALAEMGLQAARHEALARTFTASGKTVEEFADMYGMNPADVNRALEAVNTTAS